MHDFHILVLGAPSTARITDAIVDELRARGLGAWSERLDRRALREASLAWADAGVVVDLTPNATHARAPIAWRNRPRLLIAPADLAGDQRARLLDDGFDYVLPVDCGAFAVAAFTARLLPRGAFPATGPADQITFPGE